MESAFRQAGAPKSAGRGARARIHAARSAGRRAGFRSWGSSLAGCPQLGGWQAEVAGKTEYDGWITVPGVRGGDTTDEQPVGHDQYGAVFGGQDTGNGVGFGGPVGEGVEAFAAR